MTLRSKIFELWIPISVRNWNYSVLENSSACQSGVQNRLTSKNIRAWKSRNTVPLYHGLGSESDHEFLQKIVIKKCKSLKYWCLQTIVFAFGLKLFKWLLMFKNQYPLLLSCSQCLLVGRVNIYVNRSPSPCRINHF